MKKTLALLIAMMGLFITGNASLRAESRKTHIYYVEVYEVSIMAARSVCINYGVQAPLGKSFKIVDEQGVLKEFENAIGALNYLAMQGWELVSVYERDMKSAGRRTFYLLRLDSTRLGPTPITQAIDAFLLENGMDTKKE